MADVKIFIPEDSRGLSFEIDKKLDAQFNTDVQLNATQWQSIFNIIQSDQAEQEDGQNTFTNADADVSNGSQYIVHGGKNYVIKETVWNNIIGKVKEFLNIKEDNASGTADEQKAVQVSSSISEDRATLYAKMQGYLKEFLEETGLEFKGQLAVDTISKYKTMVTFAEQNNQTLDENTIKTRLYNYAKGWQFHNFEVKSLAAKSPEDFKSGTETSTTEEELKEKYETFAKQYIEYYDNDGSGDIDIYEMLNVDIKDHYKYFQKLHDKNNLSDKEAGEKAIELIKKYTNGEITPNENGNEEEQFLAEILAKMAYLDIGEDENGEMTKNNKLSIDEIKAYLVNLATQNSESGAKKHIISYDEVQKQHYDISSLNQNGIMSLLQAYDFINNK